MQKFCTILGKAPMHDSACCGSSSYMQALYLHCFNYNVSCRCVDENENAVSSSECSGQTTPASGLSCNTVPCVGYVWQVHAYSLQSPTVSHSLTAALCRLAHSLQSRPVSCHLLSRHTKECIKQVQCHLLWMHGRGQSTYGECMPYGDLQHCARDKQCSPAPSYMLVLSLGYSATSLCCQANT